MKKEKVFPVDKVDIDSIKKYPDKKLFPSTYAGQKPAILIHSVLLVFVTVMFVLGAFYSLFNWTLYF